MSSEATNSLIDFDSFDPFAPTISTKQKNESNQTNSNTLESNVFANDPFVNTFDDDNWQDAMHNINENKRNSFGENFETFDVSDNFDSNWNHSQISSDKNDNPFQFEVSKHEIQFNDPDKTNEELAFVDKTVISKPFHGEDNSHDSTDDSKHITQNVKNDHKIALKTHNCFEEEEEEEEIIYPLEKEVRPGTIKISTVEDNAACYGKDIVNDKLVFVSSIGCKIELKQDQKTLKQKPKSDTLAKEVFINDNVCEQEVDKVENETESFFSEEKKKDSTKSYETNSIITNNTFIQDDDAISRQINEDCIESSNEDSSNKEQDFLVIRTDEENRDDTKSNGFQEREEIVYEDTKINNTYANEEECEDVIIMEDRPRSKKGLAGLKEYDHNVDEEFSYSPPTRNDPPSAADKISSKIFNYGSSLENSCKQCNKKVYEMEKITVDFVIYHKSCFRCATCKRTLTPSTYSATDGNIYCKADFLKNFKMKGSYTFTPESNLPKYDDQVDTRSLNEEETPVVPMKYMKNLFEKNNAQADDRSGLFSDERMDLQDSDSKPEVVVSSNVYVLEDELPPPSLARNLRSMFENKSTVKQKSNVVRKNDECSNNVMKSKMEVESPTIISEPEETNDVPQEGMTRSLLARWRDIEGTGHVKERTRGREEKRNTGAMQRSQSTTRVEISQRMKVVSNDRPPSSVNKSKEEGHFARDFRNSSLAPRTFKWQVKEATPLNRAGIVHGDMPKYQPVTGDIINEQTPISEINRDELYNRPNYEEVHNNSEEIKDDLPLKGSYVTEIKEEELPDHAAVKSAMLRFRSMEDPTREPPVPKARTSSSRLSYHEPIPTTRLDDPVESNEVEDLPAHGTTKNLLAKFQSK